MDFGKQPEEKVASPARAKEDIGLRFLQLALNQSTPSTEAPLNSHPGTKLGSDTVVGVHRPMKVRSVLGLFFISSVTLSKLSNLSVPLFPHLLNRKNNGACLLGFN